MIAISCFLLAQGGRSLFEQVVPRPTGNNGYEEYLQAADLLRSPEASIYANWAPGAVPKAKDPNFPGDPGPSPATIALYRHLNGLSPLEVRREELGRFGRAFDLVRRGNTKPVFDPRTNMGPETLFPEYTSFRMVNRFAARAAAVYAADGRTDRAAEILLDQLAYADNMGRGVLIANLVGSAMMATTLSAFADLFPRLSRADGEQIARTADSLLARPVSARSVIPAELVFAKAAIRRGFSGKGKDLFGPDEDATAQSSRMAQAFDSLTQSERASLFDRIVARLDGNALAMDRILAGPEKDWTPKFAALEGDDENPNDLESSFIVMLAPTYSGFVRAASIRRAQLRLLGLQSRLLEYRWENGRYPEKLSVLDPLTESPFIYEKRDDGTIRVASRGNGQTGEIELKYKRPPEEPERGSKP